MRHVFPTIAAANQWERHSAQLTNVLIPVTMCPKPLLPLIALLFVLSYAKGQNSTVIGWLMESIELQNITTSATGTGNATVAKSSVVGLNGLAPKMKQWWRRAESKFSEKIENIKNGFEDAANDVKNFFRGSPSRK
ncbi:hypothetical protein QR680_018047 [Steinernema hermaphroditum]|uniref:Uncharacterized protein n=1 Tax=Steinernema hermaphroditum TaxID=289476 RepID=A0AA39HHH2_9BILA|nr:hypothetical protein QR680_018047 [Steinernema hermaphroditum]